MARPTAPSIDSVWHDRAVNIDWKVKSVYLSKGIWIIQMQSMKDKRISRRFPHAEFAGKNFEEVP